MQYNIKLENSPKFTIVWGAKEPTGKVVNKTSDHSLACSLVA